MSYYIRDNRLNIKYYINWNNDNPIPHNDIILLVIKNLYNNIIPITFEKFTKLRGLFIEDCYYLVSVPSFQGMQSLISLHFKELPELHYIPELNIPNLKILSFYKVGITKLPTLNNLKNIETLTIEKTNIKLCPNLDELMNLKIFEIKSCEYITHLPLLNNLKNLKELIICGTELNNLPNLDNLNKLEKLYCCFNNFKTIPSLDNLKNLKELNISGLHKLEYLPSLDNLTKLESLICDDCNLKELPNLANLTNLKNLYCINNKLTHIPNMKNLINLQYMLCFKNMITTLPLSIMNCKKLDTSIKECQEFIYIDGLSILINENIAKYYYKTIIDKLNIRILH